MAKHQSGKVRMNDTIPFWNDGELNMNSKNLWVLLLPKAPKFLFDATSSLLTRDLG
jgi:hypothetical protein